MFSIAYQIMISTRCRVCVEEDFFKHFGLFLVSMMTSVIMILHTTQEMRRQNLKIQENQNIIILTRILMKMIAMI